MLLASLLAFSLLALPSVVVITVIGTLILDVPLQPHWIALPLLPVLVLPTGGIGAFIGNVSRSLEQASSIGLATTLALLVLGPVAVPATLLPAPLVLAGYLNPAFYAASLIRGSLLGGDPSSTLRDVAALLVMAVLTWGLAGRTLRWRT
ncbi:MAG: hypothetical protein CSA58_08395 [Micrococcales bacterium]|nr:MAG: hypothetical protein CSA58_08395 [Micrococcales bacterium]